MTCLNLEHISRENNNGKTSLQLTHRALSDVSYLKNFNSLERLDLSFNCLTSLEGLSACVNLKWLQVLDNKLSTLKGIEGLSKLTVLNAGRNRLEKMDEICSLSNLRAVILNDNNISIICKLDHLKFLNTLVLSRNPIHAIGNSLIKLTSMTKLSLSHCKLQTIASSLVGCVDLKEARFSYNEITVLPEELAKNIKLRTLDVGNNLIEKFSEIKILSTLHNLKNLNLLGNPIAENDKLANKVKRLVPNIRILNAKPLQTTNLASKVSGKSSMHPTNADSSLELDFGVANRRTKRKSSLNTSADETPPNESLFKSFTDIGPARKENLINNRADVEVLKTNTSNSYGKKDYTAPSDTFTDTVTALKATEKKSKPRAELFMKNTEVQKRSSASIDDIINVGVHKKQERKSAVVEAHAEFKDIDDTEAPFVDLIFSKKTFRDLEREKGRETLREAKPVQHAKKMKRSKNIDSGLSALQLLSSKHEIGLGGKSAWDA